MGAPAGAATAARPASPHTPVRVWEVEKHEEKRKKKKRQTPTDGRSTVSSHAAKVAKPARAYPLGRGRPRSARVSQKGPPIEPPKK